MTPRLSCEALAFAYPGGEQAAVRGVSLTVGPGEFFSLLGPSGCGKSTLLWLIAGFHQPDSGAILLDGTPVTPWPPERRQLGMVFQNYALFPHLSVADNVAFGLATRGQSAATQATRTAAMLELVGLAGLDRRRPGELSGGQQQRVALARALAPEPRLLLLDEPLSNLDAALRLQTRGRLRELQQRLGLSVLYVTHDQEEAMALSDRVGIMRAGRLLQVGPPETLYEAPNGPFVASFLGRCALLPVQRQGASAWSVLGQPLITLPKPTVALPLASTEWRLLVRPEWPRLLTEEASVPPDCLCLTVRLTLNEYLGGRRLLRGELVSSDGEADLPVECLSADALAAACRPGQVVRWALPLAATRLVPAQDPA